MAREKSSMYADVSRELLEEAYLRQVIADHCRRLKMPALRRVWSVAAPESLLAEVLKSPTCRFCGAALDTSESGGIADGCKCNSPRGINHGLVPVNICTCDKCDPEHTGSVRKIMDARDPRCKVFQGKGRKAKGRTAK